MITEPKVTIAREPGTKNQWAKSLFYRQDGKKKSLQTKEIMWTMAVLFFLVGIYVGLQGEPEKSHTTKTNLKLPEAAPGSQENHNVPAIGDTNSNSKNAKNSKGRIIKEAKFQGPQLLIRSGLTKIPPGSSVKAILLSGATDGFVRAKTTEVLVSNGDTKIDSGTLILGTGTSQEERLKISFKQMVFQDGSFENIAAEAFDEVDQIIGLKGSKIGNEAIKLGASVGLNFAGGLSEALQDTDIQDGVAYRKASLRNAMLNGAATAALDQSKQMMSDLRSRHPTIQVPAGKIIIITFLEGN
jgi:hypothetical protein